MERENITILLGIWIRDDLNWSTNTMKICRAAYSKIPMLSKLKYVGVAKHELVNIYKMFIRSKMEYCSVVFHYGLTQEQSKKLENIQQLICETNFYLLSQILLSG